MRAGQIKVSTRTFEVVDVPTPDAGTGQVRISADSSLNLQDDALTAGLRVQRLTAPAAPEPLA